MQNSLIADFNIENQTTHIEAFKLELFVTLDATASVNGTNLVLTLTNAIVRAQQLSSSVGTVNTDLLAELATALLSQNISRQISLPESGPVAYSNLQVSFQNEFFISKS